MTVAAYRQFMVRWKYEKREKRTPKEVCYILRFRYLPNERAGG